MKGQEQGQGWGQCAEQGQGQGQRSGAGSRVRVRVRWWRSVKGQGPAGPEINWTTVLSAGAEAGGSRSLCPLQGPQRKVGQTKCLKVTLVPL